jgi:cyclohexanecarboxylate-CoA ligase
MPTLVMADPFGNLDECADGDGRLIGANEMDLRPLDDGTAELVCRGPELFLGYVDAALNEGSFTQDGYFRTGDSATIDGRGTLRISGRIKDIINRGGEKYSASQVEWVLLQHPMVAEVAVVGYPDASLGERACAFVVPTDGGRPTLVDLREHLLASGLAIQKAPERLEVVQALPRTASGKLQKFVLREHLTSTDAHRQETRHR